MTNGTCCSKPTDDWNHCRYQGQAGGHYESRFLRANHPSRPLAFWIRHTIFSPAGHPENAIGEIWAVVFDGERQRIRAARQAFPLAQCDFSADGRRVRLPTASLLESHARGSVVKEGTRLAWDLHFHGGQPPLRVLPERFYASAFPRAKLLVGSPGAVFTGALEVDGERVPVENWVGSENHNWGSRHTDAYAWGQVAGFDGAPDTFLECATARVKFGPFWSPRFSLLVLRDGGREIRLNGFWQALVARGSYRCFDWRISSAGKDVQVDMHMHAEAGDFVGLDYLNPPGGSKICLNSKLAACRLTIKEQGRPVRVLETAHRAAFEILTDAPVAGVRVVA